MYYFANGRKKICSVVGVCCVVAKSSCIRSYIHSTKFKHDEHSFYLTFVGAIFGSRNTSKKQIDKIEKYAFAVNCLVYQIS